MGPLNQRPAGHLIMAPSSGPSVDLMMYLHLTSAGSRTVRRLRGPGTPGSRGTSACFPWTAPLGWCLPSLGALRQSLEEVSLDVGEIFQVRDCMSMQRRPRDERPMPH